MRTAEIYYDNQLAGILSEDDGLYRFEYAKTYLATAGSDNIGPITIKEKNATV
jgi:hypothetical protein